MRRMRELPRQPLREMAMLSLPPNELGLDLALDHDELDEFEWAGISADGLPYMVLRHLRSPETGAVLWASPTLEPDQAVRNFARALDLPKLTRGAYWVDQDAKLHEVEADPIEEAGYEEHEHPRDRLGRWVRKVDPVADPDMYFHATSVEHREVITEKGLTAHATEMDEYPAVFVTPKPEILGTEDVWVVDAADLPVQPDPWGAKQAGYMDYVGGSFAIPEDIPPEKLRLYFDSDEGEVLEADYREFEHPRDRMGRWIRKLGLLAWEVGGAVRDPLLGKEPKDVDYMLMASPEEIRTRVEATGHRAEDLTVRDRLVGVRAFGPELPAEGVELAPPRVEVSTGPERTDFEIRPHPAVSAPEMPDRAYKLLERELGGEFVGPVNRPGGAWMDLPDGNRVRISLVERDKDFTLRDLEVRDRGGGVGLKVIAALRDYSERRRKRLFLEDIVNPGFGRRIEREFHFLRSGPELWRDPTGGLDEPDPIADDAVRRDFTLNALYRDTETGELVDPTGQGVADAERRLLRTTSPDSFREDPLRILRGLRFMSQHGLELEPETRAQMEQHADAVSSLTTSKGGVSGTAQEELDKLLLGDEPGRALRTARDTGVLQSLFPELRPMIGFEQESRYHDMSVDEHTFEALDKAAELNAPLEVRLALLFHDSGKPESAWRGKDGRLHYHANEAQNKQAHEVIGARIASEALTRLNYPGDTRRKVRTLIEEHMLQSGGERRRARRVRTLRSRLGDEAVDMLLLHRRADMSAKGEDADGAKDAAAALDDFEQAVERSRAAQEPTGLSDLAIRGNQLIDWGVPPGPMVGQLLQELLGRVLTEPSLNREAWMRSYVEQRLRKLLSEAKYREFQHPRSRIGRWIEVPDLPDLPEVELPRERPDHHSESRLAGSYKEACEIVADGIAQKIEQEWRTGREVAREFLSQPFDRTPFASNRLYIAGLSLDRVQPEAGGGWAVSGLDDERHRFGMYAESRVNWDPEWGPPPQDPTIDDVLARADEVVEKGKASRLAVVRKGLRGAVEKDQGDGRLAYRRARAAIEENTQTPRYAALRDRWGIADNVVLISQNGYGNPLGGIDDVFITASRDVTRTRNTTSVNALALTVAERGRDLGTAFPRERLLKPGVDHTTTKSEAALFRHEWAHSVWEEMSDEQQMAFVRLLPGGESGIDADWQAISEGLSKYAGDYGDHPEFGGEGRRKYQANNERPVHRYFTETLAEAVALTTGDDYRPEDWPAWVDDLATFIDRLEPER